MAAARSSSTATEQRRGRPLGCSAPRHYPRSTTNCPCRHLPPRAIVSAHGGHLDRGGTGGSSGGRSGTHRRRRLLRARCAVGARGSRRAHQGVGAEDSVPAAVSVLATSADRFSHPDVVLLDVRLAEGERAGIEGIAAIRRAAFAAPAPCGWICTSSTVAPSSRTTAGSSDTVRSRSMATSGRRMRSPTTSTRGSRSCRGCGSR